MTERIANSATSRLAADINNSTTSITVLSAASFPNSGDFRIKIDNEIMLVTGVSSNTFTVTRGYESTSATSHTNGVYVKHVITAGGLQQYITDSANTGSVGTTASRPAANTNGRNYFTTDGALLYRDNGTTYDAYFPNIKVQEPVLANFSIVNVSNSTNNTNNGGITLTSQVAGSNAFNLSILELALPAPPYKVTAAFLGTVSVPQFSLYGICLRDHVSGRIAAIRVSNDGQGFSIVAERLNTATSVNGSLSNLVFNTYSGLGGLVWLQFTDNGTNRLFQIGPSPWAMLTFFTETNTSFVTPTRAGFFVNPYSQVITTQLVHWQVS